MVRGHDGISGIASAVRFRWRALFLGPKRGAKKVAARGSVLSEPAIIAWIFESVSPHGKGSRTKSAMALFALIGKARVTNWFPCDFRRIYVAVGITLPWPF
jgi:hypothetical protein